MAGFVMPHFRLTCLLNHQRYYIAAPDRCTLDLLRLGRHVIYSDNIYGFISERSQRFKRVTFDYTSKKSTEGQRRQKTSRHLHCNKTPGHYGIKSQPSNAELVKLIVLGERSGACSGGRMLDHKVRSSLQCSRVRHKLHRLCSAKGTSLRLYPAVRRASI